MSRWPEVGERAGDRNVGQRQSIADQIAAFVRHRLLEIIEDRRQIVALGASAASSSPGRPRKRGATIRLKKIFAPHATRIVSANSSNQMVLPRSLGSAGISAGSGCLASR